MPYIKLKDRFRTSLKHYRIESRLSQEQLAEKTQLTDKYISDIERGRFSPSLEVIERISEAFETDPLNLLSDEYYDEYKDNKIKVDEFRGRISRK